MSTRRSLLCPNCKKLISGSVAHCPYCNLKNPSSTLKSSVFRNSIKDPDTFIITIITINIMMFILSVIITPQLTNFNPSPFNFLSPSSQSLLILGSTGTIPVFQLDRWWTLLAANFLHGGLLHLLFNMLALRQLGPLVANEYGVSRTVVFYTIGGIVGFFISAVAGVRFTIGASAAICSLIGALLFYGKSRGGIYGQNMLRQIGSWAIGIVLFGFLVPGINNWGHGAGMAAGVILGYLLGYQEKQKENLTHKSIALVCIVLTCLILGWSFLNGLLFVLFSYF